jgi:hypothetical protein
MSRSARSCKIVFRKNGLEAGQGPGGYPVGVRNGPTDTETLGKYITKMQAGWELTRFDLKQSRAAEGTRAT